MSGSPRSPSSTHHSTVALSGAVGQSFSALAHRAGALASRAARRAGRGQPSRSKPRAVVRKGSKERPQLVKFAGPIQIVAAMAAAIGPAMAIMFQPIAEDPPCLKQCATR